MTVKPVPRGIKQVRKRLAGGCLRTYWYHRATGERIQAEPGTAAAYAEAAGLDQRAVRLAEAANNKAAQNFAALWTEYRASAAFLRLKPRTKRDYEAVRDWIGARADKAIPSTMKRESIVKLRDRAFEAKGRRFANYVVQVVRLVLEWGKDRGWLGKDANPARGIKAIPKPKGERHLNRAWTDAEVRAFLAHAPAHLRLPFALGLFCAMREGDMIRLTWRAYDGASIEWRAGKNDERCMAPTTGVLKALLDAEPKRAVQVCTHSHGRPWGSESSFRSAFFECVRDLQVKGLLNSGTTFHGLRHTVGTSVRHDGGSDFKTAAAIGDRSTSMAATYGRDADRIGAQVAALGDIQKRLGSLPLDVGDEGEEGR